MFKKPYLGQASFLFVSLFSLSNALAQNDIIELCGTTYVQNQGIWYISENEKISDTVILNTLIIRQPNRLKPTQEELNRYGVQYQFSLALGYIVVTVIEPHNAFTVASLLAEDGYYVEFDTQIEFYSELGQTPNDFYFSPNLDYEGQWTLQNTGVPDAWRYYNHGSPDVVVGISDSGVEHTHPDLFGNRWTNTLEIPGNGLDDDHNGKVDDLVGWDFENSDNDPSPLNSNGSANPHGTNTAGVILASSNNGIGIAGIAGGWGSRGASMLTTRIDTVLSQSMASVLYAVQSGAHIVNMSWGQDHRSKALEELFTYLSANYDSVLIAAAGNDQSSSVQTPANLPSTIAVGSCSKADLYAGDSYGPTLDLVAPKGSVTPDVTGEAGTNPEDLAVFWAGVNGIFSLDYLPMYVGTSSTAPQISGAVALMLTSSAGLSPVQVRDVLRLSAEKVGPYDYNWNPSTPGHSQEMGYGRLRTDYALTVVSSQQTLNLLAPLPATNIPTGGSVSITWSRRVYSGPVKVSLYNSLGFVRTINPSASGSSILWHNPGDLVTDNDYRIKIEATANNSIFDYTDRPFSIQGVSIVSISDLNFLNHLIDLGYDQNHDSRIDTNEASQIVNLNIQNQQIHSLNGLESFSNLVTLICPNNYLTDMSPVFNNSSFMQRCDKTIDFSYNLLDQYSLIGVCDLACSQWEIFIADHQLIVVRCACPDGIPDCLGE